MANHMRSELLHTSDEPSSVSSVVSSLVDNRASAKMATQRRAWLAWRQANGDRERAHTVYVTVKRPRRASAAPVVVVGVDSHSLVSDLSANKEIYLARLRNVGFEASALEVRPARKRVERTKKNAKQQNASQPRLTPQLSAADRERIQRMVAGLPESIRPSASKALEKSIIRKMQA